MLFRISQDQDHSLVAYTLALSSSLQSFNDMTCDRVHSSLVLYRRNTVDYLPASKPEKVSPVFKFKCSSERCTTEPDPDFENWIIRLLLRIRIGIVIFCFFRFRIRIHFQFWMITKDFNKLLEANWVYM